MIGRLIDWLGTILHWDMSSLDNHTDIHLVAPVAPELPPSVPSKQDLIYATAKGLLGRHLTLDDNVPEEVGCAEAVSAVLAKCGYPVPPKGVAGVAALCTWLLANGFQETDHASPGYIIAAHKWGTASSDGSHIGICGEQWIMSNTSFTAGRGLSAGTFQANYSYANWTSFFDKVHNSPTRFFRPV